MRAEEWKGDLSSFMWSTAPFSVADAPHNRVRKSSLSHTLPSSVACRVCLHLRRCSVSKHFEVWYKRRHWRRDGYQVSHRCYGAEYGCRNPQRLHSNSLLRFVLEDVLLFWRFYLIFVILEVWYGFLTWKWDLGVCCQLTFLLSNEFIDWRNGQFGETGWMRGEHKKDRVVMDVRILVGRWSSGRAKLRRRRDTITSRSKVSISLI